MTDTAHLAQRLLAGLNGDPDQRAATTLLTEAAHGVWLTKLAGHDQYLVRTGNRQPGGPLWIDWHTLREDLAADDTATNAYLTWAQSWDGRGADDDQRDAKWSAMVPARPWHGASTSERALLRIAVDIAPGGTWAEGISHFDNYSRAAVLTAVAELIEGRHLRPGEPWTALRRATQPVSGWRTHDAEAHSRRGL